MKALAAAALLLASSGAFAQASPPPPRVQILEIEGELIDGKAEAPSVENVDARPPSKMDTLIQLRKDFRDKIKQAPLP